MSSPSKQHVPHGQTLRPASSPHGRVRPLEGYCSEGLTVRTAARSGTQGPEAGPRRPFQLGDGPQEVAQGRFSSWSDLIHTSHTACPSHTTWGSWGLCLSGAGTAEVWVAPGGCLCRHGWQHPGRGPISFLSSLIRQDTREGAHGGAHPSLRHCPYISAGRRRAAEGQS